MPRRGAATRRKVEPDPKYGNVMVAQFINKLMIQGKKSLARRIFYQSCDIIEERTNQNALEIFQQAIRNASPIVEVKPRRVGGATYQVPMEVRPKRKTSLAIRWLLAATRARSEHTMEEKLASEIISASNKEGAAMKKREDTHRMAEANRAFAHFRW